MNQKSSPRENQAEMVEKIKKEWAEEVIRDYLKTTKENLKKELISISFAALIRKIREDHQPPLTAAQLAKRLKVSRAFVAKIESGSYYPGKSTLEKFEGCLGLETGYLERSSKNLAGALGEGFNWWIFSSRQRKEALEFVARLAIEEGEKIENKDFQHLVARIKAKFQCFLET
jgi:ribosome-binding protein aMBF1 (putative translation factor)